MATPTQLGKYQITEVLGQGAMGVVYRGFDPGIRRTVAIKTIRRELVEGERPAAQMLARFRNEAQAAGKLSHPGIVAVYDYGEDASVAYIAMEYVEGNSLREYIARGTRFAERDAVSIISQLLEALAHAHERRVWHRDIKPANVIVMMNGRVKVADFGIARIEASELTQTGVMLGSPGYMAPEQYAAAQIDHRADIFAAGVVFYQLVTGAKPFVGTAEQVSYATCHAEALRPSLADPGKGWERYDPVMARALAKKPEDRFQSSEAFRLAILAAHDAPAAAAVSEETIIVEVLRPAAAVDLSASRSPQSPPPRPLAPPAAAKPAGRWGWAFGAALVVAAAIGGAVAWQAGWIRPQSTEMQEELAKARVEAEEAKRRAKAAAAAETRRQLEAERAAEAKASAAAKARRQLESERAAEAKANAKAKADARPRKEAPVRTRPPAEAPRRTEEPPPAVARTDPEPPPAAPVKEKPSRSVIPRWLWGSSSAKTAPGRAAIAGHYDGPWTATRSCVAYEELPAQVTTSSLSVKGGEFVVVVGTPGQPGYSQARGSPGDDGILVISGEGIAFARRFVGMSQSVYFRGRTEGDRFVLRGTLGDRNCTLVLARG